MNCVCVFIVKHLLAASILYIPASAAWLLSMIILNSIVLSFIFSVSNLIWSVDLISLLSFVTLILAAGLAHIWTENSVVCVKQPLIVSSNDLINFGGTNHKNLF